MEGKTIEVGDSRIVVLAPIGDIQWNGNCERVTKALDRHLDWLNDIGSHCRVIALGLGDYIDFASPSNRAKLAAANVYDNAQEVLSNAANALTREVAQRLYRRNVEWAGLLTGHHYYEYDNGATSDEHLAELLDTVHLGDCASVRVHFTFGTHTGSVLVWAHHGSGNGKSKTYALRRLEMDVRPAFPTHDVYLMGHTTGLGVLKTQRIEPIHHGDSFRLRHRDQVLCATGGWAKSYTAENRYGGHARGDYAEKALMSPASLGAPVVVISARPTAEGVEFQLEGKC